MAEHRSQREYVDHLIKDRLAFSERQCRGYGKRNFWTKMIIVMLTALISVLTGLKLSDFPPWLTISEDWISNIVLVLSAGATISAAWGGFFSPRENWRLYAETFAKIVALQQKMNFEESGPDFATNEGGLAADRFRALQDIIDAHNSRWRELIEKSA
jgi:hypothetical protein